MALHLSRSVLVEAVFQGYVSAREIRDWLACIEQLLVQQQAFFFISSTHAQTVFDPDYRAIQAVWYKQHRPAFRHHCQGLVRIARDAEELARLDTPALHSAWGVPYFVTLDRQQGYQWIAEQRMGHASEN